MLSFSATNLLANTKGDTLMPGPQWYYAIVMLDEAADLSPETKEPWGYKEHLTWPAKNGKKLVVLIVQEAALKDIQKDPRYVTNDLKDLRENHAATMATFINGVTLDTGGKFEIPIAFAGEHHRQITAGKAATHG